MNQIQLVKGIEDVTLCEKEACTFEVVLSHAYVQGQWTRDGVPLKSKPVCRIATRGKKHTLTLSRVTTMDAGLIRFMAEGIETYAMLTVTGTTKQQLYCVLNIMTLSVKSRLRSHYLFMRLGA